jgi:hypothetical protein
MLIRRKNRSLSAAAEAIWSVIAEQACQLDQARENDPLYQSGMGYT